MKKTVTALSILVAIALILGSCGAPSAKDNTSEPAGSVVDTSGNTAGEAGKFTVTPDRRGGDVKLSGTTYTISSKGEYTLS